MLWVALLTDNPSTPAADAPLAPATVATWCLQFTPRAAVLPEEAAVLMEVEGSVRLFGGRRRLAVRVHEGAAALGLHRLAWAPTGRGAVALARGGVINGLREPLDKLLDALPLDCLLSLTPHVPALVRTGCTKLGQVRALPRGGLARRFPGVLEALDRAYGLQKEAYPWVTLPETFSERLELLARVDTAPALLFGARRLLVMLCAWLAARRAGVTAITLRWRHDAMRRRETSATGELVVRTAVATRQIDHLTRLLAEHLAKVTLEAPVGELELLASAIQPHEERSGSLLPEPPAPAAEALTLVLERMAARLGAARVLRPLLVEDHRPEWMVQWRGLNAVRSRRAAAPASAEAWLPQPTFLLHEPLRLACRDNRPLYQGPLQLLVGPHRVECGWWHRAPGADGVVTSLQVSRDYWVAQSPHAGVLWIFQTRLPGDADPAWYLHGHFA